MSGQGSTGNVIAALCSFFIPASPVPRTGLKVASRPFRPIGGVKTAGDAIPGPGVGRLPDDYPRPNAVRDLSICT